MKSAAAEVMEVPAHMAREIKNASQRAADAAEEMRSQQASARLRAIAAIRRLERFTVADLAGATLRGMSTLVRGVEGANVRSLDENGEPLIDSDALAGRRTLFIDKNGRLGIVDLTNRVNGQFRPEVREALDGDLEAQDLGKYLRALLMVLRRHAERVEKSSKGYLSIVDLADRVQDSLSGRVARRPVRCD